MPLSRINSASIANNAVAAADIADGTITAAKIVSIANTQITGNIVSSQITSVANTQLTGTITGSQISSNTLSNTVFQTGSVENYLRGTNLDFGMRNRIINGAMVIDQRNAGASYTQVNGLYNLDRWAGNTFDGGAAVNKFSVIQSSTAPTGFSKSLLVTSLAATSSGASNIFNIEHKIEGFNFADFMYGTANAQTLTLSFWVRSSLTGTFGGALKNSARDRAYPFTYTISTANTFEYKTVTITGDTSGTWIGATNGIGLWISFGLGVGSTYSGTAGAWGAGDLFSATGATSVVGTNGATFYITGVQLEKGSQATPFEYRHHTTEFQLCQRYFQKSFNLDTVPGTVSQNGFICLLTNNNTYGEVFQLRFPVAMRASPTSTTYNPNTGATGSFRNVTSATNVAVNLTGTAQNGFSNVDVSLPTGTVYMFHYTVSSEL